MGWREYVLGRDCEIIGFVQASPVVGKDNPPDLADFVPSGVPNSAEPIEKVTPTNVPRQNDVPKEKTCLPGKLLSTDIYIVPCYFFCICNL